MTPLSDQRHLSVRKMINYGSFYTKPELVDLSYRLIRSHVSGLKKYTVLDSSCGYGSFLFHEAVAANRKIGADLDPVAAKTARRSVEGKFICHNSLMKVRRSDYGIAASEKLMIVGNPPYNDTTSIIRNEIKGEVAHKVHPSLKTRDLGMSFLRSYARLNADFVCVLHPLSYLIKEANFSSLGEFAEKYRLIGSVVVSSAEFSGTAPGKTYFPIVIALYGRNAKGMSFREIENFDFVTKEGKTFRLSEMVSIRNFLSKYPNGTRVKASDAVAKFWTMRDINALKRSRTFIDEAGENAVLVPPEKLPYYCYVDVFKQFAEKVPYYFGNCDVFIDNPGFEKIKDEFIAVSAESRPELRKFVSGRPANPREKVAEYFKSLLGNHYVEA